MKQPPRTTAVRRRLIVLLLATGASAVAGGLALVIAPDGHLLRLSTARLATTSFATYLVPGLLLAIVVGGSQLAAGLAGLRRHPRALRLSAVAGVILGGWIAIQAMMIGALSWLQPAFFVVAVVELGLVAANLPRDRPRARRSRRR